MSKMKKSSGKKSGSSASKKKSASKNSGSNIVKIKPKRQLPEIDVLSMKEQVIKIGSDLLLACETPEIKEIVKDECPDLYKRVLGDFANLQKQEYNIGLIAAQSAGKSCLINSVVLEFPLLPYCTGSTTCVPTVLKYGEKPKITVKVNSVETRANGSKGLKVDRSFDIPCSNISAELFKKLVVYFLFCYRSMGLENIACFTKKPISAYGSIIKPDDIVIDSKDPKHIAMLISVVLCAYINQNDNKENLEDYKLQALQMQQELLSELGFKPEEKLYTVEFYWDSPLLKKGLVFYDLPGLDSINSTNNGYLSHEEITEIAIDNIQTSIYLFKPEITAEGTGIIDKFLNTDSIRDLKSKYDRVVFAVNQIDRTGNAAGAEAAISKARMYAKEHSMSPDIYGVSAKCYGDYLFVKKGIMSLVNTSAANLYWEGSLEELEEDIDRIEKKVNKNIETYPMTPFLNAIDSLAEKSIYTNILSFIKNVYELYQSLIRYAKDKIYILRLLINDMDDFTKSVSLILSTTVDTASAEIQTVVKDIIDTELDEVNGEVNFFDTFRRFMVKIHGVMTTLRNDTEKFAKKNLDVNMFGHIVIARKKGQELVQPNYDNIIKLKSMIRSVSFEKAFDEITHDFKILIMAINTKSKKINDQAVKKYDVILNEAKVKINSETEKQLLALQKSVDKSFDVSEIEKRALGVCEHINGYLTECYHDAQLRLGSSDDVDKLNHKLVDMVEKQEKKLRESLREMLIAKINKLNTKGVIFKSTHLITQISLEEYINNELYISTETENELRVNLNPEGVITSYLSEAKKKKKEALFVPAMELSDRIAKLRKNMEDANRSNIKQYKNEIKTLNCCLANLMEVLESITFNQKIYLRLNDFIEMMSVKPNCQNEVKNVEQVDFEKLFGIISEYLEVRDDV